MHKGIYNSHFRRFILNKYIDLLMEIQNTFSTIFKYVLYFYLNENK